MLNGGGDRTRIFDEISEIFFQKIRLFLIRWQLFYNLHNSKFRTSVVKQQNGLWLGRFVLGTTPNRIPALP